MEYKIKDKEVKKRCKQDKEKWFNHKAMEAEYAAQIGDSKTIYKIVKELSGYEPQQPLIKLADGQRASTHEQQANRWLQHFESVLNCPEPNITYNFENDDS